MTKSLVDNLSIFLNTIVAVTAQGQQPSSLKNKTDNIIFLPARIPYGGDSAIKAVFGWFYDLFPTLKLLSKLKNKKNICIMHMHFPGSHLSYFAIFSKLSGLPYIVTLHGSDVTQYPYSHFLNKIIVNFTLRHAHNVVAVSGALANQASEIWPHIKDKLLVIYNGASIPTQFSETQHTSTPNATNDYFLCVGNLVPVKGFDVVLEAWKYLKNNEPTTPNLIIIGGGEQKEFLENYISENNLDELITLTGPLPREEVFGYIQKSKGVIVPSRSEGLCYTILEAGLMKKPVIATRVGGIPEIINDDTLGLLVEAEDPIGLAKSVAYLNHNTELANKISHNLKIRIESVFSTGKMTSEYYNLYQEVLKESCVD